MRNNIAAAVIVILFFLGVFFIAYFLGIPISKIPKIGVGDLSGFMLVAGRVLLGIGVILVLISGSSVSLVAYDIGKKILNRRKRLK